MLDVTSLAEARTQTAGIVTDLLSTPKGLRCPHRLPPIFWGGTSDLSKGTVAPRSDRQSQALDTLWRAAPREERLAHDARLLALGVRRGHLAALCPEDTAALRRESMRQGLAYARGPLRTLSFVFQTPRRSSYAQVFLDTARTAVRCGYAASLDGQIDTFVRAATSFAFFCPSAPIDVSDAWLLFLAETAGALEIVPCPTTGSSWSRPTLSDIARSPWAGRSNDALPLRVRIAIALLANEVLAEHGRMPIEEVWPPEVVALAQRSQARGNHRRSRAHGTTTARPSA
ncbi:MAG: hypothetical protein AAF913_12325 [Pseudomonadota bacterium]